MLQQSRYGCFDPWFSAVWINLEDVLTHKDGELGPLTVCAILSSLQDSHLEYLAQLNREDEIAALSWFSAYTHEARHFHDAITTPYGCAIARSFVGLGLLAYLVMVDITESRHLYIPFYEWVRNARHLSVRFPELDAPSDVLTQATEMFETILDDIGTMNIGPRNTELVDAAAIMESSALIAQSGIVADIAGSDSAESFVKGAVKTEAASRYFAALAFINGCCVRPLDFDAIRLILFASLCGRFDGDAAIQSYPTYLLPQLISLVAPFARGPSYGDVLPMVESYFKGQQGCSFAEALMKTDDINRRFGVTLRETLDRWERRLGFKLGADGLLAFYDHFCELHCSAVKIIEKDIHWYCSDNYAIEAPTKMPAPLLYLHARSGLPFSIDQTDLISIESATAVGDRSDGQMVVQVASPKFNGNGTNFDLWREHYHTMNKLRFLLRGPGLEAIVDSVRVPPVTAQDIVATFRLTGTRVFTMAGEMEFYFYDEDKALNEALASDPDVASYVRERRSRKSQGLVKNAADLYRESVVSELLKDARDRQILWHRLVRPAHPA